MDLNKAVEAAREIMTRADRTPAHRHCAGEYCNECRSVLMATALLELTKPLEDERLKEIEYSFAYRNWQAGTSSMAAELIAEVRRLRAGEDTRLLDRVERTVSDCYRFPKSTSATGFIYVCLDSNAQEHRAETLRAALRAAIAAEGE